MGGNDAGDLPSRSPGSVSSLYSTADRFYRVCFAADALTTQRVLNMPVFPGSLTAMDFRSPFFGGMPQISGGPHRPFGILRFAPRRYRRRLGVPAERSMTPDRAFCLSALRRERGTGVGLRGRRALERSRPRGNGKVGIPNARQR